MVGTLVQHNVGPRPRRLNVLPEIGAMMLTPQPVRDLARVSGWESPRQAYVDLDMFSPRFRGGLNSQRRVVIRETPGDGQRCQ
jgi:hypothetical protein